MSAGVVALALATGFGLAVGIRSLVLSKRKRQAEFGFRDHLVAEEVFARYYADSGLDKQAVVRLWNDCTAQLKIPAERLRPTDRFEHELAAADFWASLDDPRDDLAAYAAAHAKKHGAVLDLKTARTLDDLIRRLAAIEAHRPAGVIALAAATALGLAVGIR